MKSKDPEKIKIITAATLHLVYKNGLASLTMGAISKHTKLGMGTIYVYFKSKQDLINTLFKELKQQNNSSIHGDINLSHPLMENLHTIYHNYMLHRLQHIERHFFLEQAVNSPLLEKKARKIEADTYTVLHSLFEQGKQQGIIKKIDNVLLQAQMLGAANELVATLLKHKTKLNEEYTSTFFKMFLDSIIIHDNNIVNGH